MSQPDPVSLYERATEHAMAVASTVRPEQLDDPTPCTEWRVQDLLDHLVGGTEYLLAAMRGGEPVSRAGSSVDDLRAGFAACVDGLRDPTALARTCASPLGHEWSVAEATAGTFMDVLVHTWDLATATGKAARLDPELVDACIAMFLPDMPEHGRAAGLIGPAVDVAPDATPQERLLGAMGRKA